MRTVAGGNGEDIGGLLDRHVLDLAHHEHGSKREWQIIDPPLDKAAHFGAQQAIGRRFRLSDPATCTSGASLPRSDA